MTGLSNRRDVEIHGKRLEVFKEVVPTLRRVTVLYNARGENPQHARSLVCSPLTLTARMSKPVLLIHGTKDETVPIAHGQRLAENVGEITRFIPIEDGNHHLRNVDRQPIITEITNWLMAH